MTNLFYSQVEGVPGSHTTFCVFCVFFCFSFNYPILITYLFIYYSDVRFFLLSYIFIFIYLFISLFIYFIYFYLLIYLFIYSDIVLFMLLSDLL